MHVRSIDAVKKKMVDSLKQLILIDFFHTFYQWKAKFQHCIIADRKYVEMGKALTNISKDELLHESCYLIGTPC